MGESGQATRSRNGPIVDVPEAEGPLRPRGGLAAPAVVERQPPPRPRLSPFELGLNLSNRIGLTRDRDQGACEVVRALGVELGIPAAAWTERRRSGAGFRLLDIAGPGTQWAHDPLSDVLLEGSRSAQIRGLVLAFREAVQVNRVRVVDPMGVVLLFAHSVLASEDAALTIADTLASIPEATRGGATDRRSEGSWPDDATEILRLEQLTPREVQVLELLVVGSTSARIAEKLEISRNTVRTHIQNILSKLAVGSRLEAAAMAARNGTGELRRSLTG